jgi:hypothetical protein
MKIKTLIPFLIVLAILAGLVAWQKMNVAPPAPIAEQVGLETLVPDGLKKDNIARLEMFAGEKPEEKVILEREGEEWRVSSLYNAPAGKDTVNGFIDKLLSLKGEPRANADTEERLTSFALKDKEAFHVNAYQKDTETPAMSVLFGKSSDFKTVFLRKANDNHVFVEATNLRREAGVSDSGEGTVPKPTKWLKTKLLEMTTDKINKIALKYPDKELVFTREEVVVEPKPVAPSEGEATAEGEAPKPQPEKTYKWVMSQGGFSQEFKEEEVKSLLTRFATVTVTNVADPARKADWGFEPPRFTLTISREGEADTVLLGGRDKPGGDTYIQQVGAQPELIYQISKLNFEQLFLQGSKLFTLPEWTVAKESILNIAISGPQGNTVVAKEGDAWKVVQPQLSLETQKTALDNLTAAVASLKPVDYADAGVDVGAFDTTVTLTLSDGATRILRIGQVSPHLDGRYVKFDGSEAVLVLARTDVDKLLPPVRDLFVLSVLDFEAENIKQIYAKGENAELTLVHADDSSQWSGTFNGTAIQPEPALVDDLVMGLNDFQVENFLLDRAVDSVQPVSTIKVTMKDGTETTVNVSAETNGQYELTVSSLPYVFTTGLLKLKGITDVVARFADLVPKAPEPAAAENGAAPVPTPTEGAASVIVPGADAAASPQNVTISAPPAPPAQ